MPRGVPRNRATPAASNREATPVADRSVVAAAVPELVSPEPTPPIQVPPTPSDELTADQRMIRELQNQLAVERGKKDAEAEYEIIAQPGSAENIVIHFLEDGFTAQGQIWYRGQELEFEVGSRAYKDTFDRLGRSWLNLAHDDGAQMNRWGKVMFRPGPWPGRKLSETKVAFEPVKGDNGAVLPAPTPEDLAKAEAEEAKRRRAAPRLQSIS